MSAEDVSAVRRNSQEPVMNMGDEIDLFNKANDVTRRDAELCLHKYLEKFNWFNKHARVLDIGCGDGSVTTILSTFLPKDYEVLVGADINPNTVKYANDHYGNKRTKFVELDIEGALPDDMKESFDHVFSFYTFHWIDDHQKAFSNIYKILQKNGEFFAIFLLFSDVYLIYEMLGKSKKWSSWMPNFNKFPSPYYDFNDPDDHVEKMLKNIGFNVLDVRCKQRVYRYDSIDVFKNKQAAQLSVNDIIVFNSSNIVQKFTSTGSSPYHEHQILNYISLRHFSQYRDIDCTVPDAILTAICPFDVPKDIWPEFLEDFMEIKRKMHLVDENSVKIRYNLMVIHCTK